jgi:hypothetical protein
MGKLGGGEAVAARRSLIFGFTSPFEEGVAGLGRARFITKRARWAPISSVGVEAPHAVAKRSEFGGAKNA